MTSTDKLPHSTEDDTDSEPWLEELMTSSSNCVRIKQVSEINDANNADISSSIVEKRKLPPDSVAADNNLDEASGSKRSRNVTDEATSEAGCLATTTTASTHEDYYERNVVQIAIRSLVQSAINSNEAEKKKEDATITAKIKTEPSTEHSKADVAGTSASSSTDIKPTATIKKEEASSTSRESCRYGIRCYRRNPVHRIEEAHPGDHDYKRPNFPAPALGTPDCPYGDACYRRNPTHFEQFSHPPETDFESNWKNHLLRLRQRRQRRRTGLETDNDVGNGSNSDLDDSDLEDPFADDGDFDEYVPSENEKEEEEDDDDAGCDRAEE